MILGLFDLPAQDELDAVFAELVQVLRDRGYSNAARLPMQGKLQHLFFDWSNLERYARGELNLKEMSAIAPLLYRTMGRRYPDAVDLFRVFALNQAIERPKLERLIGSPLLERLIRLGMILQAPGGLQSRLLAAPVGEQIFFHDTFSIHNAEKLTHVFLGRCSVRLARSLTELFERRHFERALDLCTGSGVQALQSARFSREVVGVDINPRAVALARANAHANGVTNSQIVYSDLFEKLQGTFDLISANTPFLLLEENSQATSGKGGELGIEVALRIFERLSQFLRPGGIAKLVVSTAWVDGKSTLIERLRMLPNCDYRLTLSPINTYYDKNLYRLYTSLGVSHCTLYLATVERTGASLTIVEEKRPALVDAAYGLTITANRWLGRRRSERNPSSYQGGADLG